MLRHRTSCFLHCKTSLTSSGGFSASDLGLDRTLCLGPAACWPRSHCLLVSGWPDVRRPATWCMQCRHTAFGPLSIVLPRGLVSCCGCPDLRLPVTNLPGIQRWEHAGLVTLCAALVMHPPKGCSSALNHGPREVTGNLTFSIEESRNGYPGGSQRPLGPSFEDQGECQSPSSVTQGECNLFLTSLESKMKNTGDSACHEGDYWRAESKATAVVSFETPSCRVEQPTSATELMMSALASQCPGKSAAGGNGGHVSGGPQLHKPANKKLVGWLVGVLWRKSTIGYDAPGTYTIEDGVSKTIEL